MSDITGSFSNVNTDEVAQDKPVTEALFNKIGANINGLIARPFGFEVFFGSGTWTCPEYVKTVLAIGVGGGGGGGGGGDVEAGGSSGGPGDNTLFNNILVAEGGVGGEGASSKTILVITRTSGDNFRAIRGGRGRGGGQNGNYSVTSTAQGGLGGPGIIDFNGARIGSGGEGGTSGGSGSGGGAGGGAGAIGFRLFTVTPGATYNYTVGNGGNGGNGADGASDGVDGNKGALALFYLSEP